MMKLVRSIAFTLSVASVSVAAIACSGTVEQSPQTSASAATKAPVAAQTRGAVRLVGEALGDVALRPEQRTEIEKLAADADARHASVAQARRELMVAFADQIERGAIDRTALDGKVAALEAALDTTRAEDRAALVQLHGILDAEQRNAFADAVQAKLEGMRGAKRGTKLGPRGKAGFGGLKHLAQALELTDDQKAQLREAFREAKKDGAWKERHAKLQGKKWQGKKWSGMKAGKAGPHAAWKGKGRHGVKKALEAFRQDTLDLDEVALPKPMPSGAFGLERMTSFAEKVLPVLTPEQRKVAADKLRAFTAERGAPFGE